MINNFNVGERIRELRQERALSQEQLAHIAEITPAYLGQVERGMKNVTVFVLEKICTALNISLSDFFCDETVDMTPDDEIHLQILQQLKGKTYEEKQAILKIIKIIFNM